MTKIIVVGINGKMGRAVVAEAESCPDVEIVAGVDVTASNATVPVFDSLANCTVKADVIVDFSRPSSLASILDYAGKYGASAVLCTTGYSEDDLQKISAAQKDVAIFRSANMSLGVNVLCHLARRAAGLLNGYDVEIVEAHHRFKVDAPSGTALMLADEINDAMGGTMNIVKDRSASGKRQDNEIGIQSIRGGNIVGEHDVMFIGSEEIVTLSHHANSRSVFAKGALEAARFVAGKAPGHYDMNDLIISKGI